MSKAKFTKGEWVVLDEAFVYALNDDGVNQFDLTVQGNGDNGASDDELQANARLIAAAPEMYEILEGLSLTGELDQYQISDRINAILAKARGDV